MWRRERDRLPVRVLTGFRGQQAKFFIAGWMVSSSSNLVKGWKQEFNPLSHLLKVLKAVSLDWKSESECLVRKSHSTSSV